MSEKPKLERPVVVALLLLLVVVAVYWPVTTFEFTNYDDTYYVTTNPQVQNGLTWQGLAWAFGRLHGEETYWHPLTWLSHMADYQMFGLKPGGHHLGNLLLHALNTVLVFWVFRRMTGALWSSALLAALFGLHPLQVDTVAWVAERKNLLSALFWLLTMWAYIRYAECRSEGQADAAQGGSFLPSSRTRASAFYLLALLFFALGLMSKPVLVTLPFVLLLLDYWPLGKGAAWGSRRAESGASTGAAAADKAETSDCVARRTVRQSQIVRRILEKVPFLALAAASSVITVASHQAMGGMFGSDHGLPLAARIGNAVVSYARYLGKVVWPVRLAVFYPHPGTWPLWQESAAALLVLVLSLVVIAAAHSRRYLCVGWFWFLGVLVPFIGLIQAGGQAMADRFVYVPLIGLLVMVVWAGKELLASGPRGRRLAITLALLVLGAWSFRTRHQLQYWRNSETLFRHAIDVTTNNLVAYNSLGFYFVAGDQPAEAGKFFQEALRIQPNQYSWHGLGAALISQGKYREAVAACEAALKADPRMAKAHSTLGVALTRLGETNAAISHYLEALRLQPELADAHYNLANALANQGQVEAACEHYLASLRSDPSSADAHNNLAYMLVREGQLDRAVAEFRSALALRPDSWQAHYGLASALARQGKVPEAIQHYRAALATRPDFVEALNRLAWLLAAQPDPSARNGSQAVEWSERACRLTQYRQPGLLRTLAVAYAEAGHFAEAIERAREAQNLAQAAGQTDLARNCQQLLELFQAGQPYHDPGSPRAAKPE